MTSVITSHKPTLKLFRSGLMTAEINTAKAAGGYYTVGQVDLGPISQDRVTIYTFGNYIFNGEGLSVDQIVLPNMGSMMNVFVAEGPRPLDGGYILNGSTVTFVVYDPNSLAITPVEPFQTARIYYSIFYY